ncbi:MAG: PKD domain-containing protein [Thermoplasmata archaeon]|nr:PKD domain-containing protein [Thermoplasmata archaeon]
MRRLDRARGGAPASPWAIALGVALLLAVVAAEGCASGSPAPYRAAALVGGSSVTTFDAPILSLAVSPSVGNAPLFVNVTVSVSDGVGPYNLSVCFGTADHQSPAPNCGVGNSTWSGSSPLDFSHVYLNSGNFSVVAIASDARGAGVGSTALIVVTDQNSLGASAVELTGSGPAPLTATFNETVAGGTPPITLQWTFGDGTSGSELPGVPVHHLYESPGVFTPQLTVTDSAGHRTVRTLPSITVTAGATSPFSQGSTPVFVLLAALAGTILAAGLGFRFAQTRRWRREGDELVARLQTGPPRPPNRMPP